MKSILAILLLASPALAADKTPIDIQVGESGYVNHLYRQYEETWVDGNEPLSKTKTPAKIERNEIGLCYRCDKPCQIDLATEKVELRKDYLRVSVEPCKK